eukprot:8865357-Karenia_brevis.AAC.1
MLLEKVCFNELAKSVEIHVHCGFNNVVLVVVYCALNALLIPKVHPPGVRAGICDAVDKS